MAPRYVCDPQVLMTGATITTASTLFTKYLYWLPFVRLLGLRDNTKLGFWRPLIGQGEKWTILKAQHLATRNSTMEDVSARGQIMKLGDSILFQSGPLLTRDQLHGALRMTETVLVMHEGVDGCEPRMIGRW